MNLDWRTKLIHPQVAAPAGFRSLATPTYRGSTTLFASAAAVRDDWDQARVPYSYGLYGTPTTFELAARLADLEGGAHCFLTPGGQAAIALILLTFTRAGGHALLPESVYEPTRDLADRVLLRLGVTTDYYDPLIGGAIAGLIRENTQVIWCESPGSATMEVQDVSAITAAARQAGVVTALDNTYAAGILFDAFAHGVDVTMQALTKYVGGHSDLLLGAVTVRDAAHYQALGDTHQLLGLAVSPDECSLALRGLQTLGVRLGQLEESTMAVARWLGAQPQVERLLHPAFPSCPGHDIWRRDFSGSASVFSVVFRQDTPPEAIIRCLDALTLFKIGYSWGGVTSLVMPQFHLQRTQRAYGDRLVRFNVGLEAADDLLADLEQGFAALRT
jgi:cysteine-S-conjugate beta-lyase